MKIERNNTYLISLKRINDEEKFNFLIKKEELNFILEKIKSDNQSIIFDNVIEQLIFSNIEFLKTNEIVDFYSDFENFKSKLEINVTKIENKKLFLFLSREHGYDTYDSIIVCEYTEERALEIAMKHHRSLRNCYLDKVIGVADESLEIGVVLGSFRAG